MSLFIECFCFGVFRKNPAYFTFCILKKLQRKSPDQSLVFNTILSNQSKQIFNILIFENILMENNLFVLIKINK